MSEEALSISSAAEQLRSMNVRPTEERPVEEPPETPDVEMEDAIEQVEENSTEEVDTAAETPPESPEAADAETDAEEAYELDVEQLAQLLGVDSDTLSVNDEGELRINAKVDGKVSETTLNEALQRYQTDAHLTNKGKELAAKQKQVEEKLNQFVQQSSSIMQQAQATLSVLEDDFVSSYQSVNWAELRENDPAEYAARQTDMAQRRNALQQKRMELAQQAQQAQSEIQQQQAQLIGAELEKHKVERDAAFKTLGWPAWDKTKPELFSYLEGLGFEGQMLEDGLYDHRLIVLAEKARRYDAGSKNLGEKQVKKLPKVLKPGTKPSKGQVKNQQMTTLKKAHKKSGTVDSAAELFRSMRKE